MQLPAVTPKNSETQPRQLSAASELGLKVRGIAKRAKNEVELYRSILSHPRTPILSKVLLAGAVAYVVSPIDLLPDFLPAVGWLDDLIVVPALAYLALEIVPNDVIQECRAKQKASNHPPHKV